MKTEYIVAAALCAQIGLAIPHGIDNHQHIHNKREVVTTRSILTEIVTVTDYNAVVWVDSAGKIVKTEHKTSVAASAASVPVTSASSFTNSVPPVAQVGSNQGSRVAGQMLASVSPSVPTTPLAAPSIVSSTSATSIALAASFLAATGLPGKDVSQPGKTNKADDIPGFGVAYDANSGSGCRPSLDSDFAFLASKGASMIRVYDSCFSEAVNAAAAHNLKLMIGITNFDDFDNHLNTVIRSVTGTAASWSVVDTVFIGNEVVDRQLASSSDVAGKVSIARGILKSRGFSGNVITVDTWTQMRNDPTICSTSDYCAANAHAFFDGNVLPGDAGKFVRMAQSAVAAKNSGKRVVISESGWPYAGNTQGIAVPSIDNQRSAIGSIVKEFATNAGDLFLFMAYDSKYKTGAEIERNFGIFDSDHYNSIP